VRVAPLPALSEAELAAAFSRGLDLAEGKPLGHAQRVCHIALALADSLALPSETRLAVYYGALLHEAGVAPASAELCRRTGINEDALFGLSPLRSPEEVAAELPLTDISAVIEVVHRHCEEGAGVATRLGLPPGVAQTIHCHHERWDGGGYPQGLSGQNIPKAAQLVAVGDLTESLIAAESSPLAARCSIVPALARFAGSAVDPELVTQAKALVRNDSFWLRLYGSAVPRMSPSLKTSGGGSRGPTTLHRFAEVFAALADDKGEHTGGHSPHTARWAGRLASALGLSREHVQRIELATLVHHVGLLGVPARIMAKPDILSLAEMQVMRRHPSYSYLILEDLPGLEDVAAWVHAHHERPDGKGYPEMLEGDAIPLEARVIALVETYVALTSERPYRHALSCQDAQQVLLGAAGSQLDEELVRLFCTLATDSD
jgi:HD-GYP domain-containing protein (c-di-GMP phosphodiesterase class II)